MSKSFGDQSDRFADGTLSGGPRKVERRYTAPFALPNREEDYKIAWEFFEGQA